MNLIKRRCCPCQQKAGRISQQHQSHRPINKSPKLLLKNATMMRFQLRRRSRVMLLVSTHTHTQGRQGQCQGRRRACAQKLFCQRHPRRPAVTPAASVHAKQTSNWTRQEIALHFTKGSISFSGVLAPRTVFCECAWSVHVMCSADGCTFSSAVLIRRSQGVSPAKNQLVFGTVVIRSNL
jgi:hypothetical protein